MFLAPDEERNKLGSVISTRFFLSGKVKRKNISWFPS
jgi:hypothetical protein